MFNIFYNNGFWCNTSFGLADNWVTYSIVQKKLERTSPKFNIGEQIATFRFGRKSREISVPLFFTTQVNCNDRKIT